MLPSFDFANKGKQGEPTSDSSLQAFKQTITSCLDLTINSTILFAKGHRHIKHKKLKALSMKRVGTP